MKKDSLYLELENSLKKELRGEVRFDKLTKILYSTDASNYSIEPIGLVIPKTVEDVIAAIKISGNYGAAILPRGGGTSLAGQAVGHALIIDFSKYLNRVLDIDKENMTVRVEPGIYLDDLNRILKTSGLMFGPDPSSAKVATVGGVVGNNATGAHSVLYGMAGDNVKSTKIITADGDSLDLYAVTNKELFEKSKGNNATSEIYGKLNAFREKYRNILESKFPRHWRRASGYSLNYLLDQPMNPSKLLAGSEGTLAIQTEYMLKLENIPNHKALAIVQYTDFRDAMESVPGILEHRPSAIELIDSALIELTREQSGFSSMLTFVDGSPEAILAVEFYGSNEKESLKKADGLISALKKRKIKVSGSVASTPKEQANLWNVRKAGLGLLASKRGDFKPIACIEDVSVPVDKLAEYSEGIKNLCGELDTSPAFYGHASAGCLHVRPFVNLKSESGVRIMEELSEGAFKLIDKLGGVMSGEHGDGIQRSYLNERLFGKEIYGAMKELKDIFDPHARLNPGKIVEPQSPTNNLRYGASYKSQRINTFLDWSSDYGIQGGVEMCNGQGVCRKTGEGIMCPSYRATMDETDTTRARANALRAVLSGNLPAEELTGPDLKRVFDLCVSCKACKSECPSSVDAAKMKLEFMAHYNKTHGLSLRKRIFGGIHDISKLSAKLPTVSNIMMNNPLSKLMLSQLGITPERTMPKLAGENLLTWFDKRDKTKNNVSKKAVYFHDTWSTYYAPEVGIAAVRLLEAAGFEVVLEEKRVCCGRPMMSEGMVEESRTLAWKNVSALLPHVQEGIPIIGTEPSCVLAFRDEYPDLLPNDKYVSSLAQNSYLLSEFLAKLNRDGKLEIKWKGNGPRVLYHGHCHERSMIGEGSALDLLGISGCYAISSNAGCCGMAGGFGYESEHYKVSKAIGEDRLFPIIREQPYESVIAVSGFSCGHQIEHFTNRQVMHISQVLANQLLFT